MIAQGGSRILILDYGSQFTQLIARRVREAHVYSEIHPPTRTIEWIREWKPSGIILSGGPNSVYGDNVPSADKALLDIAPVLGICYGMQLIAHLEGARVTRFGRREYGRAELTVVEPAGVFAGFDAEEPVTVWESHGDAIETVPKGYHLTACSTRPAPSARKRLQNSAITGSRSCVSASTPTRIRSSSTRARRARGGRGPRSAHARSRSRSGRGPPAPPRRGDGRCSSTP